MVSDYNEEGATWGCDDVTQGTLHSGYGDARVKGLEGERQTDEQTADCMVQLRTAQRCAADPGCSSNTLAHAAPLEALFAPLATFALRHTSSGGDELKLYDAMASPDRQLLKLGYFVAEGSIIVEQLLELRAAYRLASLLSTENQLLRLAPVFVAADQATRTGRAAGRAAEEVPCVVYAGSKARLSGATGFKHSVLSLLAVVRRPVDVHTPLSQWLPLLQPASAVAAAAGQLPRPLKLPTLLVLDAVTKPENVGALFRTALAFGVGGVVLSPGTADPLYRKAVRTGSGPLAALTLTAGRAHMSARYGPRWGPYSSCPTYTHLTGRRGSTS